MAKAGRLVTFHLCVGNSTTNKVWVNIYKPGCDNQLHLIECHPSIRGDKTVWTSEINLLREELCYKYLLETTETRWWIRKDTSTKVEPNLRRLPSNIDLCYDVLKCPDLSVDPESFNKGIHSHLEQLFRTVKDEHDLKQKLRELGHLWVSCSTEALTFRTCEDLRSWTERTLPVFCTKSPPKAIFLSVLYGKLTERLPEAHLRNSNIMISDQRKAVDIIEDISTDYLTTWAVLGLKTTSLQFLECVSKNHWLHVAANFPHLFTTDEILHLKFSMSAVHIDERDFENVIIPKIVKKHNADDARHILMEIPSVSKLPETRERLQNMIDKVIPTTGSGSSSSKDSTSLGRSVPANAVHVQTPLQDTSYSGVLKRGTTSETLPVVKHTATSSTIDSIQDDSSRKVAETFEGSGNCLGISEPISKDSGPHFRSKENTSFKLLIRDMKYIKAVTLVYQEGNDTPNEFIMDIKQVKENHFNKQWILATKEFDLPPGLHHRYHYVVSTVDRIGPIYRSTKSIMSPTKSLGTSREIYDVFKNKNDINISRQSGIKSETSFVYIEMFFPRDPNLSLKDLISLAENVGFPGGSSDEYFVSKVIEWICDLTIQRSQKTDSISDLQIKFVAVLLGKLMPNMFKIDHNRLSLPVLKQIIEVLGRSSRDEFPTSVEEDLKNVCQWLICETKGTWVVFWQHFFKLFNKDHLLDIRKRLRSPSWVLDRTWEWDASDKTDLTVCIERFQDQNENGLLKQLIMCALDECGDTRVLQGILDLFYTSGHPIDDTDQADVISVASNKLNRMITSKWTYELKILVDISRCMSSYQQLFKLTVNHIRNYLLREFWEVEHRGAIEYIIYEAQLYQTSNDLIVVFTRLLKQPNCFKYKYRIFINMIRNPDIMELANEATTGDVLKMGIQSLILSCRSLSKQDGALRLMYKVLATVHESNHLICYSSLTDHMEKLVYTAVKDKPLDWFVSFLCPETTEQDISPTEIRILASHTIKRINGCKSTAVDNDQTSYLKLLQDNDGTLEVRSEPLRDVMIALSELHEHTLSLERCPPTGRSTAKLEAGIQKILKDSEFWLMILRCRGKYCEKLKHHISSKAVSNALKHFAKFLLSGDVSIQFMMALKEQHILVELLNAVDPCLSDEPDKWVNCVTCVQELYEQFDSRIEVISKFYNNFMDKLYSTVEISDKVSVSDHLKKLQLLETSKESTLKATGSDEFWGPLYPLVNVTTELKDVMSSVTFLNVCRSVMEGTYPDDIERSSQDVHELMAKLKVNPDPPEIEEDENNKQKLAEEEDWEDDASDKQTYDISFGSDTDTADESQSTSTHTLHLVLRKQAIDTQSFARLIVDICLPKFHRQCSVLTQGDLNIPVSAIARMMDGVSSLELLNKELVLVPSLVGKSVSSSMKDALSQFVEFSNLRNRSDQLKGLFRSFDIDVDADDVVLTAMNQIHELHSHQTLTLQQLHDSLETLGDIIEPLKDEDWDIIEQLSKSKGLVKFLREIIGEDLRHLIDAVEELSEQHVKESTVSDLIEVKRYMMVLLQEQSTSSTMTLLGAIQENRPSANKVSRLPLQINSCVNNVHHLRDLYNSLANRSEMTNHIIQSALEKGVYNFTMDERSDTCHVALRYKQGDADMIHGLAQLNDYRNRAFLSVNTQTRSIPVEDDTDIDDTDHTTLQTLDFEKFVACINTINDIIGLCSELRDSGHFSFRRFEEDVHSLEELQRIKEDLTRKLDHWQQDLNEARDKYYYLNFFHSKQLWLLDQFFSGEMNHNNPELILLFRFVDAELQVDESFRTHYQSTLNKSDLKARLFHLGLSLETIFKERTPVTRPIPGQINSDKGAGDSKVSKGDVFVAQLDEGSSKSIPVLLRLYFNTTGVLPEPSHVIFCHEKTKWEEISLLLKRCIGNSKQLNTDTLFALVNVECLPTEIQFQLVNEVQRIQTGEDDFFLALLCCAGSYHHIIDRFSPKYNHVVHGLSDAEMISCLRTGWPEVEVVTSSHPGQGKTEYIKDTAYSKNMGLRTVPISGPISKEDLVECLHKLSMNRSYVLHVDASPVSHADLLDVFLFELAVIGMSVSGTKMCFLPTRNIVIEVANTYQDKLRNALTVCSSFSRKHLGWTGFNNLVISQNINSPVQVVCHYLKALHCNSLDTTDIVLRGPTHLHSLPPTECRTILSNLFASCDSDMSYATLDAFLSIFAQELRHMSSSVYFHPRNLSIMLGKENHDVRSKFVGSLLDVSKQFTTRAVTCQTTASQSHENAAEALLHFRSGSEVSANQMVDRMQGMVKWADSNHLLMVFHRQDSQTISALYRMLDRVPTNIRNLFETQMKRKLEDYNTMKQEQLHSVLEKVCRSTRVPFEKDKLGDLKDNYALTPDNLLKMILIFMKVKARIPVIIMGETGCGKTTLITYLARVCEVPFVPLNLHAGVTKLDIVTYVLCLKDQANRNLKQEVWGFLDEINTCDHLGLINEIICHRTMNGEQLPSNLIFIAACNPYALRSSTIEPAGLEGKHKRDEMSKLVYRVHPLPETMMDFVWDYGSLDKKDEEAYVNRMLGTKDRVFVDLVVMSQNFMRDVEQTSYCVSLRDVHRCKHLAAWFEETLRTLKEIAPIKGHGEYCNNVEIRSIILALAHCYHSRLTKAVDRNNYRCNIARILGKAYRRWLVKESDVDEMIKAEQLDILGRMQLSEGTAKNEALRENVFVMLVSILNRIPVFVVGKPGCSKSLSMQLIKSNLRGPDSGDPFFRALPTLYVVSYQGSESSTSEGIIKVFEKAKNYKKHSQDAMPVVLLDEIGLAEISSFNPLKVLHSQLEPSIGAFPPIAVVGISNWALDAAKMNRAIHLSRPEPTVDDLWETAKSIRDECANKHRMTTAHHVVNDEKLQILAKAYSEYMTKQKHTNFHGLRDYYSLVKYVATLSSAEVDGSPEEIIQSGVFRNFGGLSSSETLNIVETFTSEIRTKSCKKSGPDIMQLITESINDKKARHLMLITNGDSALNILEQCLIDKEQVKHVTLFGSRFANDISEEYNYTILSEIILYMESGIKLVLRDLENIYGSLYDMLNQNYTTVGKKRNCRIALGPYSNPMCNVHEDFRCIVLVDEKKVDYQNPPFLNRFEKQTLRFSDILSDDQKKTIDCISEWMDDICSVEGYRFSKEDMFLGLHNDTLPSLVYAQSLDETRSEQLTQRCKNELAKVACPISVLRASKSTLMLKNTSEVERFQKEVFSLPVHNGIGDFFEHRLSKPQENFERQDEVGLLSMESTRTIIYTHSSVHTNIATLLEGVATVQVEKLSNFKSERHFNAQMRRFWFESDSEILVLQCLTTLDAAHMILAKNRIDQHRSEYTSTKTDGSGEKHACMVVHLDRGGNVPDDYPWQFNFLCGWQQFTVDSLEPSTPHLVELLHGSVSDHLAGNVDLGEVIKEQLLWCFSCIRYEDKIRKVESSLDLASTIAKSDEFVTCLVKRVLGLIRDTEETIFDTQSRHLDGWQVEVATYNSLLYTCSTLSAAMVEYMKQRVREPLGKVIVELERANAWCGSPIDTSARESTQVFWQACFFSSSIFDVTSPTTPVPRGPESCLVNCSFLALTFPFFQTFHAQIQSHKHWLWYQGNYREDDDEERIESVSQQLTDVIDHTPELHREYYLEDNFNDYENDLFNIFSVEYVPNMAAELRIYIMRWLVRHVLSVSSVDKEKVADRLARLYVNIWCHHELLAALLQLIAIYADVTSVSPDILLDQVQNTVEEIPKSISKTDDVSVDEELVSQGKNIEGSDEPLANIGDKIYITGQYSSSNSDLRISGESRLEMEAQRVKQEASTEEIQQLQEDDQSFEMETQRVRQEAVTESASYEDPLEIQQRQEDATLGLPSYDDSLEIKPSQEGELSFETQTQRVEQKYVTESVSYEDLLETAETGITGTEDIEDNERIASIQCKDPTETILVSMVCKNILPTTKVFSASDGIDRWQQKATSVLLLAGKVNADSPVLHFLRLCRDFVTTLCKEFEVTQSQLIELGELGEESDDPLASESVFELIVSTVRTLKSVESEKDRLLMLDHFLTSYFGLCMVANLDTPLLPLILYSLCSDTGHLLAGSRPVLLDVIRGDIQQCSSSQKICERLISTGEINEDEVPNLIQIDDILREQEMDAHLSVVCCDIIEEVAFQHITCYLVANISSDDETLWACASDAVRVATDKSQTNSSLQLVVSAAFIRSFATAVSELIISSNCKGFRIGEKHYVLSQVLNSLLKPDGDTSSCVLTYLLKTLRQRQSLWDLRKICNGLTDPIKNLGTISWEERLFTSRLGYFPMSYVKYYSEAIGAISSVQVKQDKTQLEEFISTATHSAQHRVAFLAAVTHVFYFIQSTIGQKDVDKHQAEWMYEATDGFNPLYRYVLQRLLGLADFHGILQISESTSQENLEIASVIIHIVVIIVSNQDQTSPNTTFLALLGLDQTVSSNLLHEANKEHPMFEDDHTASFLGFYDCVCKERVAEGMTGEDEQCPMCGRKLISEQRQHYQRKPLVYQSGASFLSSKSATKLSPIAYRTIDTIVSACIYGSLGSNLIAPDRANEALVDILQNTVSVSEPLKSVSRSSSCMDIDFQIECEKPVALGDNPLQIILTCLMSRLENNIHVLSDIIQEPIEKVTLFLHHIVKCLEPQIVHYPPVRCGNDQLKFEEMFADTIDREALSIPQCLVQHKQCCLSSEGIDLVCLETKLEELDIVNSTESLNPIRSVDEKDVPHTRRLFRSKRDVSLDGFLLQFAADSRNESKTQYLFLKLCLSRLDALQLVGHLPALLKWLAFLTSRVNGIVKRDEVKQIKVVDFLSNKSYHPRQEAVETATSIFDSFRNAWNEVREGWSLLTGNPPTFDSISSASNLSDCVIDKTEENRPIQDMIEVLVEVQNNFLMDAVLIAREGKCSALNFLFKGDDVVAISTTPLQRAGNSIIQYQWSDKLLEYHDIDTDYGKGGVVSYKYATIERELARVLVLKKAILIPGEIFSQFRFSDDLSNAYSTILSEIGSTIVQQDLPTDIISSIKKEQEYRQGFSSVLLNQLEMLLVLLKKTGGDPGHSLNEYIRRWLPQLPGSFSDTHLPGPRDGIKLQHIVSLYETLEDQLVDSAVGSMRIDYQEILPDKAARILEQNLKPKKQEELETMASILRRFIFRFLRTEVASDTKRNLVWLVDSAAGRTMECKPLTEVLPEDVEVRHVVKILEVIDRQAELRKQAQRKPQVQRRSSLPPRSRLQPTRGTTASTRRRGGTVGGVS